MISLGSSLSSSELSELSLFLDKAQGAMPLAKVHGFLAAIASAPELIPPSTSQPMIVGDHEFETKGEVERIWQLLGSLYNQVNSQLLDDRALEPLAADDDELALWCSGYLTGARLDEEWISDEEAVFVMLPIGVLAGEFDLTGTEDANGNIIEDPTPYRERYREMLPSLIIELYDYWLVRRMDDEEEGFPIQLPMVRKSPKVGRNEPCPCGSGRKFKKCCIEAAQ